MVPISYVTNYMQKNAEGKGIFLDINAFSALTREFTKAETLVFAFVVAKYIEHSSNLFIGQQLISRWLDISKISVTRAIKELRESDLIETKRRYNDTSLIRVIEPLLFIDRAQENIYGF